MSVEVRVVREPENRVPQPSRYAAWPVEHRVGFYQYLSDQPEATWLQLGDRYFPFSDARYRWSLDGFSVALEAEEVDGFITVQRVRRFQFEETGEVLEVSLSGGGLVQIMETRVRPSGNEINRYGPFARTFKV